MSIGSSLDVVSSRPNRPRGQRGRGLSKESHDGHFKFKSPNAVPATLFVPANVQHAAAGPPWTMAHASRNGAPGHQRTLPMLTPTGSTDKVPHPGRPYHGTRPRTYPNVRSGDAACKASFQLIDLPTRLCGQEQASGACSKLAAKRKKQALVSGHRWSPETAPLRFPRLAPRHRAAAIRDKGVESGNDGFTDRLWNRSTTGGRMPSPPQAREHSVRPETHDISTTTVIRHGGQR